MKKIFWLLLLFSIIGFSQNNPVDHLELLISKGLKVLPVESAKINGYSNFYKNENVTDKLNASFNMLNGKVFKLISFESNTGVSSKFTLLRLSYNGKMIYYQFETKNLNDWIFEVTDIVEPITNDFKFSIDGFTDYVVTECKDKAASYLYKKTLDWISFYYKNPKEVLRAQIENDYIRFEGTSDNILCQDNLGFKTYYKSKYVIEISFKDGKYKFDVIEIQIFISGGQYSIGSYFPIALENMAEYYNTNGQIKNRYKDYPSTIPIFFNSLNYSLRDFIMSNTIPSKNKDW